MRNDFEQLKWLYSIGVEDNTARQSINYFDVQINNQLNDSSTKVFKSTDERGSYSAEDETII